MEKGAIFSDCGKYRYRLWRIWDVSGTFAQCVGLNPSTANSDDDDNTIRNLTEIIKNNGYGGFYMTNLFALISPYPEALRECPDPIKDNDVHLRQVYSLCQSIIFCWGNFKQAEYRAKKIIKEFPQALCFGMNANGSPKHPLYLKQTTKIIPYGKDSKIHG